MPQMAPMNWIPLIISLILILILSLSLIHFSSSKQVFSLNFLKSIKSEYSWKW